LKTSITDNSAPYWLVVLKFDTLVQYGSPKVCRFKAQKPTSWAALPRKQEGRRSSPCLIHVPALFRHQQNHIAVPFGLPNSKCTHLNVKFQELTGTLLPDPLLETLSGVTSVLLLLLNAHAENPGFVFACPFTLTLVPVMKIPTVPRCPAVGLW